MYHQSDREARMKFAGLQFLACEEDNILGMAYDWLFTIL